MSFFAQQCSCPASVLDNIQAYACRGYCKLCPSACLPAVCQPAAVAVSISPLPVCLSSYRHGYLHGVCQPFSLAAFTLNFWAACWEIAAPTRQDRKLALRHYLTKCYVSQSSWPRQTRGPQTALMRTSPSMQPFSGTVACASPLALYPLFFSSLLLPAIPSLVVVPVHQPPSPVCTLLSCQRAR